MKVERTQRQWPGWIDDVLEYEPLADLESEWRTAVGDAIVRVLDSRAGLIEPAKCERCGSLKTLACTIVGCGLPRPHRWRLSRWLCRMLPLLIALLLVPTVKR